MVATASGGREPPVRCCNRGLTPPARQDPCGTVCAMLKPSHVSTRQLLQELLDRRILLLDGSMGALLYSRQPTEEDYRGTRFRNHPVPLKNCTEAMVLSQPKVIEQLHREYL